MLWLLKTLGWFGRLEILLVGNTPGSKRSVWARSVGLSRRMNRVFKILQHNAVYRRTHKLDIVVSFRQNNRRTNKQLGVWTGYHTRTAVLDILDMFKIKIRTKFISYTSNAFIGMDISCIRSSCRIRMDVAFLFIYLRDILRSTSHNATQVNKQFAFRLKSRLAEEHELSGTRCFRCEAHTAYTWDFGLQQLAFPDTTEGIRTQVVWGM